MQPIDNETAFDPWRLLWGRVDQGQMWMDQTCLMPMTCLLHAHCSQSQAISLPTLSVTFRGMTHISSMTHLSQDCIKITMLLQKNQKGYSCFQFSQADHDKVRSIENQALLSINIRKSRSLNISFETYSPQTVIKILKLRISIYLLLE